MFASAVIEYNYSDWIKEQDKDKNILYIKNLIKNYGSEFDIKRISSTEKRRLTTEKKMRLFLKNYKSLCLVDDILFRRTEDHLGITVYQFVQPENLLDLL